MSVTLSTVMDVSGRAMCPLCIRHNVCHTHCNWCIRAVCPLCIRTMSVTLSTVMDVSGRAICQLCIKYNHVCHTHCNGCIRACNVPTLSTMLLRLPTYLIMSCMRALSTLCLCAGISRRQSMMSHIVPKQFEIEKKIILSPLENTTYRRKT